MGNSRVKSKFGNSDVNNMNAASKGGAVSKGKGSGKPSGSPKMPKSLGSAQIGGGIPNSNHGKFC